MIIVKCRFKFADIKNPESTVRAEFLRTKFYQGISCPWYPTSWGSGFNKSSNKETYYVRSLVQRHRKKGEQVRSIIL